MTPNPNANTSTQSQNPAPAASGQQDKSNRNLMLYLVVGIVAIGIIAIAAVYFISPAVPAASLATTIAQNHSASVTPVYMSPSQAQLLIGSQISYYNASDLFNPDLALNMSVIDSVAPSLQGNVTSAWITYAAGTNSTSNASVEYFAFQGSNAQQVSSTFSSLIISSLNITPSVVTPGTANGLSYSYSAYENSTVSAQVLSGWKGNNVVLIEVLANPGFTANETQLVNIAANDTP